MKAPLANGIFTNALFRGLNLYKLNPEDIAPRHKLPAYFIHASQDTVIPRSHTERNYKAYRGAPKDESYFNGTHIS